MVYKSLLKENQNSRLAIDLKWLQQMKAT
jgi:hypothetical protein